MAERETESKELRLNISELEANTNDLHEKFEQALAHLEQESDEKDNEIAVNNEEIQKLGDQVYTLEEENDKLRDEFERVREDDIAERERLEALSAALKDVSLFTLVLSPMLQEGLKCWDFVETRIGEGTTTGNDRTIRTVQPRHPRPPLPARRACTPRRGSCGRGPTRTRNSRTSRVRPDEGGQRS